MDDTAALDQELEDNKVAFHRARMLLGQTLGTAMPEKSSEEIFISHAQEFGVDATLQAMMQDPGYFELGAAPSPGSLPKLREQITAARDLADQMMNVFSARERVLMAKDPTRKPRAIWMGKEFIINPEMQTITYVDTGQTYAYLREDDEPRRDGPAKDKSR